MINLNDWKLVLRRWDGYHHEEIELTLADLASLLVPGTDVSTNGHGLLREPVIRVRPDAADMIDAKPVTLR